MTIYRRGDWLLFAIVLLYAVLAPFTKVEESFAVQATHDLLFHGKNLTAYDHNEFPGVVPRTFLGPLSLSAAAYPLLQLSASFVDAVPTAPRLTALIVSRAVLGAFVVAGLARFRRALSATYGPAASTWFLALSCAQFHLPFYASRPLPNTFALALSSLALAYWLERRRPYWVVFLLAFTASVVRCDVLLLAAPVGLEMLFTGALGLFEGILVGALSVAVSVGASVAVDSHLWGRRLWPEGEVLFFNTVENRSHEWGTSPFHWYFSSALPRGLGCAFPFALLGLVLLGRGASAHLRLLIPALFFVGVYSWLPHKELRFLFPALPLFNAAAAVTISRIRSSDPSVSPPLLLRSLLRPVTLLALLPTVAFTALALWASALNYPGGEAVLRMHEIGLRAAPFKALRAHIGVLPAMTGVSRFLELPVPSESDAHSVAWSYSKEEGLSNAELAARGFDFILADGATAQWMQETEGSGYRVEAVVDAYAGWDLQIKKDALRAIVTGLRTRPADAARQLVEKLLGLASEVVVVVRALGPLRGVRTLVEKHVIRPRLAPSVYVLQRVGLGAA